MPPSKDDKNLIQKPRKIKWVDQLPPKPSPKQIKSFDKDNGDTDEQELDAKPPSAIALEAAAKASPAGKKKLLVTNNSRDDLVHREIAEIKPVETHKKEHTLKSVIKPFTSDFNKLTGLSNFTKLSKDPLALPTYARSDT